MVYDPNRPTGTDNYPDFAAGTAVLLPDGWNPRDNSVRPWVPATVVAQKGIFLHVRLACGKLIDATASGVKLA